MRILIIDKHEYVVGFLKEAFESQGADVIFLEHQANLLNQIKDSSPDIILSGYFLDSIKIVDVLKFVKNNLPETKLYIMSSYPFLDIEELLFLGADGFFKKTDGLNTIVDKILKLIE